MFKKIIFLITSFIILTLTGCRYQYSGDYPELYAEAINSLLWNKGASMQTERFCNPKIVVLDTDSYGRVLFKYTERYFSSNVAFSSLLISQLKLNNNIYYYEDYNFICKEKPYYSYDDAEFEEQDIEKLKILNDWNKELKIDKCVKKEITNNKKNPPIKEDKLEDMFSTYEGYYNNSTYFLTEDEYGKFICYSRVKINDNMTYVDKYIVTLFEEDLTYSFFEPTSFYNYQEEFKDFKKLHNWNCAIV